jgi:hypothetical protein
MHGKNMGGFEKDDKDTILLKTRPMPYKLINAQWL